MSSQQNQQNQNKPGQQQTQNPSQKPGQQQGGGQKPSQQPQQPQRQLNGRVASRRVPPRMAGLFLDGLAPTRAGGSTMLPTIIRRAGKVTLPLRL